MTTPRFASRLPLLVAGVAVAATLSACGSSGDSDQQSKAPASLREQTAAALRSTVAITVRRGTLTRTGTGTKLATGLIVTDRSLVTDASGAAAAAISVRTADGDERSGIVDGTDPVSGLAAVRVRDTETLPSVKTAKTPPLGDDTAGVGWISARRPAVHPGVVLSRGRSVRREGVAVVGLWETSANLGAQGAGGPILNARGETVGITTRALAPMIPGAVAVVPIKTALSIGEQLRDSGRVRRAFLGIDSVGVTPTRAQELRLKTSAGLILRSALPGSPAAFADLQMPTGTRTIGGRAIPTGGDVIVSIDGKKLTEPEDLDAELAKIKPGAQVKLRVIRDDRSVVVSIRTGER